MIPTPRFAGLIALGAVFWVAAAVDHRYYYVAPIYLIILACCAIFDWLNMAKSQEFTVHREFDERMNLGTPNPVRLHIRHRRHNVHKSTFTGAISLIIRDEAPQECLVHLQRGELPETLADDSVIKEPVIPRMALNLAAGATAKRNYWVTPSYRGDYRFGDIYVRYFSPWKLWQRQFCQKSAKDVRVYPDTSAVRKFELRIRQGRLHDMGLHLQKRQGQGTEFESLRDYTTDDEFRNINWKASARRGHLVTNTYQIERNQIVLIALDCGRMMTALSRVRRRSELAYPIAMSKLDWTINAAVLLSHAAASMGDSVGLLLFSDQVAQFIPPRKGATQTGLIIEALYQLQPSMVEPDYRAAYQYLLMRKLRRALIVTFTDIVDRETSAELLTASTILRRRHNPLCITVNNQDVLTMAARSSQDETAMYQKAMAVRMLSERRQALDELHRRGVGILDVDSAQLALASVNRYMELRARAAF